MESGKKILTPLSDSVKRHLSRRHLSRRHLSFFFLNFKFNFIFDGGCTREEQIALSLKRHLFLHGDNPRRLGFIFDAAPYLEYFFQFFFQAQHESGIC